MKSLLPKVFFSLFIFTTSATIVTASYMNGAVPIALVFITKRHWLKKWPDGGPKLIWEAANMGDGYSSVTVTDDAIYVTGRKDSSDVLTALTLDGKLKWKQHMAKHG